MKSAFLRRFLPSVFLSLLLIASRADATVVWMGAANPDVINDDLDISGNVTMTAGATTIRANTGGTFNANLIAGNSIISGNGGAASQIYICVDNGSTFNFNVTVADLTFQGSADPGQTPLLIVVSGTGTVNFNVRGGRTFTITGSGANGGVQFFNLVSTLDTLVSFQRDNSAATTSDARVVIGQDSLLSYITQKATGAGGATERARIQFDPSNASTGQFFLDIQDTGGFVVAPHFADPAVAKTSLTLGDIDLTRQGADEAIAIVNNAVGVGATAQLMVLNRNAQLFDLLIDPFCNLDARNDMVDFNGSFSGVRYGFVVGANGILNVNANSYLDYVALACNVCPALAEVPGFPGIDPTTLLKTRNPSALFVDGSHDPNAVAAQINVASPAAVVFRSGVNDSGVVENDENSANPFTIDPMNQTTGAGKTVFDIEGQLYLDGAGVASNGTGSKIEILSLEVNPTGGVLHLTGGPTIFPNRTFAVDGNGSLRQYNSANWFVNNKLRSKDITIEHTDRLKTIIQKNDVKSEPAYIGGETHTLKDNVARPCIDLINASFDLHESAAFAGVDVCVPSFPQTVGGTDCVANQSDMVFYQNGKACDRGTGRFLIMGTQPGSFACNGCNTVDRDAHLDIFQTNECNSVVDLELELRTGVNNNTIIPPAECNLADQAAIALQPSVHTIYLGHASNIQVGINADTSGFTNNSIAQFKLQGNFFSFETRGGSKGSPQTSNVTGEGGIFVDLNGSMCIGRPYRASVSAMITKSRNGAVALPKEQVFFDCHIAVSDWQLDLTNAPERVIVDPGEYLTDYTLNWLTVTKDFQNFCPYIVTDVGACDCPAVTAENVASLPSVQGTVDQLQIDGSRLGDQAHVEINCGHVKELVFLKGSGYTGQAPIATVVLTNDGRLGLNSRHINPDSLEASAVLGVNGVQIIANGDGLIDLNEDVLINNTCSILAGPNFTNENVLRFQSDCCRKLTVKQNSTLDLRSFTTGEVIEIGGDIQLILEPGARILMGGGTLRFTDRAKVIVPPVAKLDTLLIPGNGLASTDPFRVRLMGTGTWEFTEDSEMTIIKDGFFGIETRSDVFVDPCGDDQDQTCEVVATNITFAIRDCAHVILGDKENLGGAFQVGNTADRTNHTVAFSLLIDGRNAGIENKSCGFIGLGDGIVDKRTATPDTWSIDRLFDVTTISITLNDGEFKHNRIFAGNDNDAHLLAIDGAPTYNLTFQESGAGLDTVAELRARTANMFGGGNIVLVTSGGGGFAPVVQTTDGTVNGRYSASILASSFLQDNDNLAGVTGAVLFAALKTADATNTIGRSTGLGNISDGHRDVTCGREFRETRSIDRVGYVDRGMIGRQDISDLIGVGGQSTFSGAGNPADRRRRACQIGAAFITVDGSEAAPGTVILASTIQ